jgi:glycosyltransferase involved in cell wall biosynthesis
MKVQIVSKHIINPFGTTQLRCIQPAEYLISHGIKVSLGRLYRSIPKKRQIIIIHRAILDEYTAKFLDYANAVRCIVVYDIDDLLFDNDVTAYFKQIGREHDNSTSNQYKEAMKRADVVLVSTELLADKAKEFHRDVRLIRNALSRQYLVNAYAVYRKRQKKNTQGLITVGYLSGSKSHDRDFQLLQDSLLRLLHNRNDVKILLVGRLSFSDDFMQFGSRFEFREFVPYSEFAILFSDVDINLIPLEVDQVFCQAKSELKYLEAGACGVPSVASPTRVYKQVIENKKNGILVGEEGWYKAILFLINHPGERQRIGEEARQDVLMHYSPSERSTEWKQLIENIWDEYEKTEVGSGLNSKNILIRLDLERRRCIRTGKILVSRAFSKMRDIL